MSIETSTADHKINKENLNDHPLEFISQGNESNDVLLVIDTASNAQLGTIRTEYDSTLDMLSYHGSDMNGEDFFYPTLDIEVLKGRFALCKNQLLGEMIKARYKELKSIRDISEGRALDNSLTR